MSGDTDPGTVLELLNDEYARDILTETSVEPMSAKTLAERCDASLPTVYRRTERLAEAGLIRERTKPDESGNHYSVYEARLDSVHIDLGDGTLTTEVTVEEDRDVADRFTDMWESI